VAMRSRSTRPRASRPSDPPRSIDLDSLIKLAENLASHATDTRPTTHSPAPVSPRTAATDPTRVRKHASPPPRDSGRKSQDPSTPPSHHAPSRPPTRRETQDTKTPTSRQTNHPHKYTNPHPPRAPP
jgi:hypothetical protein